jgi:hypothetical protein
VFGWVERDTVWVRYGDAIYVTFILTLLHITSMADSVSQLLTLLLKDVYVTEMCVFDFLVHVSFGLQLYNHYWLGD